MSTVLLSLIVLVVLPSSAICAGDTEGKEFILGFMENQPFINTPSHVMELFITTPSTDAVMVNVTAPLFKPSWIKEVTVTKGTVKKVNVPATFRGKNTEKSNKGIWIQATEDVSVYGVNLEKYSTDAYLALPVDVLGWDYYAITYQRDAELMVIGTHDNTQVSIKWPDKISSISVTYNSVTYKSGDTLNLTLNRFETFHARQGDFTADFTGAHITANKPIAVLSGNKKVPVPVSGSSADHLTEMLTPVDMWGKSFITTSTPDRSIGDIYRFVASENDTRVAFADGNSFDLQKAGDFWEYRIPTGDYRKVTSNKPVMVTMFSKTFNNDGPNHGDPAMSLVIPEDQYGYRFTWATVQDPRGGEFNNKITVIISKDKASGLRLDGAPVTWVNEKDVIGSTKVHLWTRVNPGSHTLDHVDSNVTFMALATGTTQFNSYAYQAGMTMARINPIPLDGQWGNWGSYGSCSVTCGTGTQSRTRLCDDPTPENGGKNCSGTDTETVSCEKPPCAVDGQWGQWGAYQACSVTCGNGTKTRTRNCDNPSPEHGGAACSGSAEDIAPCQQVPCPINGGWSSFGPYGSCSVTCGTGTRLRTRTCDNPAPQHGGAQCPGSHTDALFCDMGQCPVNGNWGNWEPYGPCSVTCGTGTKVRTRHCDNPAPQHGGNECSGSASHVTSCFVGHCSSCTGDAKADIVFVLDGSGSVGPSHFEDTKKFIRDLVDAFDIGSDKVRVAVQVYTHVSKAEFHLNQYHDKQALKKAVMDIKFPRGASKVGGALDYLQSTMFSATHGDRAGVANVGVVFTDGHLNSRSNAVDKASKARRAGIELFVIAIGQTLKAEDFAAMATDVHHVFTVHKFSELKDLQAVFHAVACTPKLFGYLGNNKADIVFLLDASGSVGASDFNLSKQFLAQLVDSFDVASDKIRVAAQTYASVSKAEFHLNQYHDKEALKKALMEIDSRGGTSKLDDTALDLLQNTMFSADHGEREGIPKICVVLINSHIVGRSKVVEKASKVRKAGIQMHVVGIGEKMTAKELFPLVSDRKKVFLVKNFVALKGLGHRFYQDVFASKMFATWGWTLWGAWSECSRTCGGGHRSRSRQCVNPEPNVPCSGDALDKSFCAKAACPNQVYQCPALYVSCVGGNISCVHYLKECDCVGDCQDGSDERSAYLTCHNPMPCPSAADSFLPAYSLLFLLALVAAILPLWVTGCGVGK